MNNTEIISSAINTFPSIKDFNELFDGSRGIAEIFENLKYKL